MKIHIQPICRVLALIEYDERMAPGEVFVWVNPTRAFLARRDETMREFSTKRKPVSKKLFEVSEVSEANEDELFAADKSAVAGEIKKEGSEIRARLESFNLQMCAWYAELWSRGEDMETHWTADEVQNLSDLDPALFTWLINHSDRAMKEHRTAEKKS